MIAHSWFFLHVPKDRPTNTQALVYYKKSFHVDINMVIVMYKHNFPKVYQTDKIFEHTLVSFRKLQLKHIILPFPNVSPKQDILPIPYSGVLALPPLPPRPLI